jgi:cyclic 2,3-diphosphoglycerate synthetase
VLIDGEHYASVVRDALAELPYEVVGAILVGGTEKLRGGEDYGVALRGDFGDAEIVVDLSDEPVLGPAERMRWASRALAAGLPYVGADFRFDPPRLDPVDAPSIAVIGTGKRVGKTAVTGHLVRLLARQHDVIVVAMGRGGPPEPEVIEAPPTVDDLLELSRSGRHAASDHLETAAICGVTTIGCRRAGGGLAGAVTTSNVLQGARLAVERSPDVIVFDGSGAAIPPVAVDRRVLVVGGAQDADAYLNTYRRLISDVVVAVNCEVEGAITATLRLRPVEPVDGRVAVFTAGGTDVDHLEADVVHVSRNLADRDALREELARVDADTYLVEVKAAAIDVVAEHARAAGKRVVLAGNDVVAPDLDGALLALAPVAASRVPRAKSRGGGAGLCAAGAGAGEGRA